MLRVVVSIALVAGCGRIGFDELPTDAPTGSFAVGESPTPPCNAGDALVLDGKPAGLDRMLGSSSGFHVDGMDEESCVGVALDGAPPSVVVWMRATTDACGVAPCTEPCGEPYAEVFAGPTTDPTTMLQIGNARTLSLDVFEPYTYPLTSDQRVVIVCRQSTGSDRYDVLVDAILAGP